MTFYACQSVLFDLMVHQIAHLIVTPEEKRSITFRAYTAKASKEEKKERGLLFATFTIDYYHHRNDEIVDGIIEELAESYYDKEAPSRDPEALLEETLRLLNTTLQHLIETEQIFLNLNHFHAVIGVIRARTVTFTQVGDLRAFLFHRGTKKKDQLISITDSPEKEKKKTAPLHRVFRNVFSGALRTGDVFLVASPSLFDYVSHEQVRKIMSITPLEKALAAARKAVRDSDQKQLGTMLFGIRLAPDHETPEHGAKESLKDLFAKKTDTHAMLAPSALRTGLKRTGKMAGGVGAWLRRVLNVDKDASRLAILGAIGAYLLLGARQITRVVFIIGRALTHLFRATLALFRTKGDWRERAESLAKQSKSAITPLGKSVRALSSKLTMRHRVLVIAGVIVLVLFVGSISYSGVRKRTQVSAQAFAQQHIEINDRLTTAEASKIFKDETRTRAIYTEALSLVRALPAKEDAQRVIVSELEEKIAAALEELRRARRIDTITVLFDVGADDSLADSSSVFQDGDTVYVANGTRPKVLKRDKDGTIETINTVALDLGGIRDIRDHGDDTLLLTTKSGALGTVNKKTGAVKAQSRNVDGQGALTAAAMYGARLYALDPSSNSIWRHGSVDLGFGGGSAWITDGTSIADGRDLAIDGSIWVAGKAGITRLLRGQNTGWAITGTVDPPELDFQSLYVPEDVAAVYALDRAHDRILQFNKDSGRLIAQYPLPAEDIRDVSIDPETNIVLLLTPKRVIRVSYE
jgi:hypothetical protein